MTLGTTSELGGVRRFELTSEELRELTELRLAEAKILAAAGFNDGAYYVAGYAVELALKAAVCKRLNLDRYPTSGELGSTFKTHKFTRLLLLAGLEKEQKERSTRSPEFLANWSLASAWSEDCRYEPKSYYKKKDVDDLLTALEDSTDGVLTWLKRNW